MSSTHAGSHAAHAGSGLHGLNPPQRQAVTTLEGPLLVLAGAGSGKTRVITHRVAYLLEHGVPPEAVLAVSFTNKAADEMRERVEHLVGKRLAERLTLSTFHALGLQILKAEKSALGFIKGAGGATGAGFTVYDSADQLGCIRECLRSVKMDDRRFDAKAVLARISRAKNAFVMPEEFAEEQQKSSVKKRAADENDEYDVITAAIYPKYQAALRSFHAFDFDDLIVETVRLLERDERVRGKWQKRFRYVMVDEYQDTNRSQLMLVNQLVALHKNLCVVGDDDQSIYAWRGAEPGNILDFGDHFPGAKKITLDQNYRSTPTILAAANAVIKNNGRRHDKTLFTDGKDGVRIQLVVADEPEDEARFVAEELEALAANKGAGVTLGDCAILYRSNIQARPFEEALKAQRIDYRMIGGQAFFERKEVKDAIAYLRVAVAPRDEIAVRRVVNYPARGVGETTVDRCAAYAAAHKMPLFEALRAAGEGDLFSGVAGGGHGAIEGIQTRARESLRAFVALVEKVRPRLESGEDLVGTARELLDAAGLKDDLVAAGPTLLAAQRRIDNLEGFFRGLATWEQRVRERAGPVAAGGQVLADYLHRLTLASSDEDDGDSDQGAVTLVTLHGAKGLEFKVVFLVGLEEELLPHKRTLTPSATDIVSGLDTEPDISEERRLMYVGITRARERLYLSRCRVRGMRGEGRGAFGKPRAPSRFLAEIPEELVEKRDVKVTAGTAEEKEAVVDDCRARLRALLGDSA